MRCADCLFDFGAAVDLDPERLPLASVAGSLIVDSGEEDTTFVFRCQDRYVVYSALAGLRSLLFVVDARHVNVYDACLNDVGQALSAISARTGVLGDVTIPAPVYVAYDPISDEVTGSRAALTGGDHAVSLATGIRTNQISPLYARLFRATSRVCAPDNVGLGWDLARCDAQAHLALHFYDKASYVDLLEGKDGTLPAHTSTAVLDADAVLSSRDWSALCAMAGFSPDTTLRLHVKSSLDSGGNVAAVVARDNMSEALGGLEKEWRAGALADERARARRVRLTAEKIAASRTLKPLNLPLELVEAAVTRQAETRAAHHVRLLVQARVEPPSGVAVPSVGCSYWIGADGRTTPICAAQQIFADSRRTKHVGAFLHERFEEEFCLSADGLAFQSLCRLFAARGYQGPISFDAVANEEGRYVGVFDCNPRLTAVFPPFAVREALRAEGLSCEAILNVDYRGLYRWPDLDDRLTALDDAGLLYTRTRQKGVFPLPNLAQDDGFDLHLVNLSRSEIEELLAADYLGEAHDLDKGTIHRVFG